MKPILTVMLIVLTTFCQAECPIECFCDRVTTCTGDKLLTRFPKIYTALDSGSLLTAVPIRVELHDYAVRHLIRQDFLDIISNLTEVSISRNSLETFDNETFSPEFTTFSSTSTASHRDAIGASIAGDSKSVSGDEQQKTFFTFPSRSSKSEVSPNQDGFGPNSGTFLQLKILDLSQNKLKHFVGGGKLRKLKILDLSSNVLQQVYELSAMESLESVNLRDNRISYLEANIFQNLRNLQYVNLDSNVLGFVDPSTFSNLPSLAHLILSSNPISNLLPGFYWNSRVQFVDVSSVGLTSIPPSLTKTVRDFRCANNNLTIIRQTDFESYPNVGLLVLDENAIEIVEDDAFGRLDFLSRLWINGNRLKRIPQNLPPSLRSLQLEDNRIVNLSSTDFRNLKNLEELNLHSNRISSLPPSVFSELTSLKSLDLRSNQIDVIYRDSFANLSKLETLDISQNPIKVVVTGAFGSLRKVTLLHLSRLMEPIELDASSFKPLQNLQILELDDSPHLALKLFQDSAFSYFPNLYEINVQRCELEDVNLVSNALVELNLRSVKMSGNPWECEDLHGSSVLELMSRRTIVDEPTCSHPPSLQGSRLASLNISMPKASLNVIKSEKNPNFTQTYVTPLTRSGDSLTENFTSPLSPSGRSLDTAAREHTTTPSIETVLNTKSPEKVTHVAEKAKTGSDSSSGQDKSELPDTPVYSATVLTKPGIGLSLNNSFPVTVGAASSNVTQNNSATAAPQHGHEGFSLDRQGPSPDARNPAIATTEANTFFDLDKDIDVVPTQSYFDYPRRNSSKTDEHSDDGDERDSSVSGRGSPSGRGNKGTNSISSNLGKPPMNLIPIYNATTGHRTRRPTSEARSSKETKTNDDNAIIDESRRSRLEKSKEKENGGTAQRSIDGFPLAYPDNDRVTKEAASGLDGGVRNPKYSYLKLQDSTKEKRMSDLPYDNTSPSPHMAVIVKTLVISALTCLGSILSLFLISLAIYRYSTKRNRGIFPCARRCSNQEGEDTMQQGSGMVYTRFGRGGKSRRRDSFSSYGSSSHHHQPESDSDQVELSGITNSLYFENEDIYHIT